MSREAPPEPDPRPDEPRPDEPPGTLRPTPPLQLLAWLAIGLAAGLGVRPVCDRLDVVPPLVSGAQPAALLLLALILGYVAWATHRAVHVRRERLQPHQAVNRLVLARASAIAASLFAGAYVGYALSWIGAAEEMADDRMIRAFLAAAAALAAAVAALLLERACRVHRDDKGA